MFIKNIFLKIIEWYNYLFDPFKFRICSVYLTYIHDGSSKNKLNSFWKNESKYWLLKGKGNEHYYWTDISKNYKDKKITKVPKHVYNVIFKIKYCYLGKKYTCLNTKPYIPIEENVSAKFNLPIIKVCLTNSNDKTVNIDVTNKYIKYLGPKKDFHKCTKDIKVEDLFTYTDYDRIHITNIINQTKTFNSDVNIHHLL